MEPRPTSHRRLALQGDHAGAIGASEPAPRLPGQRRRMRGEKGYVLAMTAMLILPLLVFVSFAIDAGAWYAQASRIQRAADAATLAAVVWLPNTGNANSARDVVAAQNGFTSGVSGSMTSPTTYRVTITASAPRFFSATFDSSPYDLTRTAEAEFNKPVPLGSPANKLGNDVSTNCPQFQPVQAAPCGPQPMLWSSIQGPYEAFANGDPYTTKCARGFGGSPSGTYNSGNCTGANFNSLYRTTGYNFAIDVKPADVGKFLTFQIWDAGSYVRPVGTVPGGINLTGNSGQAVLTRTTGTFSDADLGKSVTGNGIPLDTFITARTNTTITLSRNLTQGGSRAVVLLPDCNTGASPFNAAPYVPGPSSTTWGTTNCQAGDSDEQPFQVQVYDNDGEDLTVSYSTPIPTCHRYIAQGYAEVGTFKNKWATICTFQANTPGVYPVRVKSSGITLPPSGTVVTDSGSGWNQFSVRVTGGTTTRMYALDDISMWTNTPSSDARFYLADIGPEHAGKRLQLDLYDPGDGQSGTYTMQVLAPPSGAPTAIVPNNTSTVIPDALNQYATSCRYNDTPSTVKEPNNVTAPAGNVANNCTVTTRVNGGSPANKYNEHWLRIEIKISDSYTCTTDCWWSIKYNFGGTTGIPTDRTVWSIKVVGDPVHLVE